MSVDSRKGAFKRLQKAARVVEDRTDPELVVIRALWPSGCGNKATIRFTKAPGVGSKNGKVPPDFNGDNPSYQRFLDSSAEKLLGWHKANHLRKPPRNLSGIE